MMNTENFWQVEGNKFLRAIDESVLRTLREELSKYINVPLTLPVTDKDGNKVLDANGKEEVREIDFNQLYDLAVKEWVLVDHNVVERDRQRFIQIDFYRRETTIKIPVKTKFNIEIMAQGREVRDYSKDISESQDSEEK